MDKNQKFRDQLFSQEKTNPEYQKNFQLEVKKMYTEALKKGQRFAYLLTSLLVAFITLLFWTFSKMFEEIQISQSITTIEPLRLASTWAMYLGAVLLVLSMWPAIRGKVGLRFYPKAVRFISWILILAMTILSFAVVQFLRSEMDFQVADATIDILGAAIISILIIIMAIYMLLSGRIDRSDLKNKAKTLELEYRIAELEEKLNQSK